MITISLPESSRPASKSVTWYSGAALPTAAMLALVEQFSKDNSSNSSLSVATTSAW